MSAKERLEFQEYFVEKLTVAAQLRVLFECMCCHCVLLLLCTLRDASMHHQHFFFFLFLGHKSYALIGYSFIQIYTKISTCKHHIFYWKSIKL